MSQYSTTDPGLPFGQEEIGGYYHTFGLNVDHDHLKRKHRIEGIQAKVNYTWRKMFKYH